MNSKHEIKDSSVQESFANRPLLRERIGLVVDGMNAAAAVTTITTAEEAGVRQIWMTQGPSNPDTLTIFAAAAATAAKTSRVRLGTAIVPAYTHHPLSLAQQALAIDDIAPGRLRLGIGPSHRPIVESIYGLSQTTPLTYMREYLQVLRAILWDGKVNHHGHFFNVVATMPRTAKIPLLTSTLGERAFLLAGEISDGALSWLCPVSYLRDTGLPALRKAAAASERSSEPPLVAHVLVALSQDSSLILEKGHQLLSYYTKLPFYAKMFTDAGFPIITSDGGSNETIVPDALVKSLVISGGESSVAARFKELLDSGLGELMVTLVPIIDAYDEQTRLMQLIGGL
jgi:alkanesulfonate monooxygenase SsuD/methylene tetrahydromethanopterin reductase-like flavin-dependent oxidoreductase (luciferase family)